MRIIMSFGVKEVFKDQERGWYDEIKKSEKPNLGMSPWYIPEYLKKTQTSKLGDAHDISFFINKVSGHLYWNYILIQSYLKSFYLERLCVFVFVFVFV